MSDPFKIIGPAVINFSSGKTSAFLLWKCLQAGLDDDVFVCIQNTSKEREESLKFAHEIETRWNIPLVWLERMPKAEINTMLSNGLLGLADNDRLECTDAQRETLRLMARRTLALCYRQVTYETAARDGSVFEQLINERGYVPNPVTRYCTTEMKTLTVERWMRSRGHEHWTEVMGLRADEPARVARMRGGAGRKYRDVVCPLAEAGIVKADVDAFWRTQSFTLELRPWEGNCDLCHLKGISKTKRILRDRPDLADWWIRIESKHRPKAVNQTFRTDRPAYAALLDLVQDAKRHQPAFAFADDDADPIADLDDLGDCVCSGAA